MAIGKVEWVESRQRYLGEYRDRDGDRRFVSDKKEKECQKKLRMKMNEVDAGTHARKNGVTLQHAIKEYVDDLFTNRVDLSNSYRRSEDRFKMLSTKLLGVKLADLTDAEPIRDELIRLRKQGVAVRTLKHIRGAVSRTLDFAVRKKLGIPRNVLKDDPITLGRSPKRKNSATVGDAALLLKAAREFRMEHGLLKQLNLYAMLCLICQTGIRPEEACGLHVQDIQRLPDGRGRITIRHTYTALDGLRQRLKNTEEGEEDTRLPLIVGQMVLDALDLVERFWQARSWAMEQYESRSAVNRGIRKFYGTDEPLVRREHGLMFLSRYVKPFTAQALALPLYDLCRRVGLVQKDRDGRIILAWDGKPKPKYSLYSFRHMVATWNKGLPTDIAAAITGHSEKTYLGHYVHRNEGDVEVAAESLRRLEQELAGDAIGMQQQRISWRKTDI